jgi:hypothetical protein
MGLRKLAGHIHSRFSSRSILKHEAKLDDAEAEELNDGLTDLVLEEQNRAMMASKAKLQQSSIQSRERYLALLGINRTGEERPKTLCTGTRPELTQEFLKKLNSESVQVGSSMHSCDTTADISTAATTPKRRLMTKSSISSEAEIQVEMTSSIRSVSLCTELELVMAEKTSADYMRAKFLQKLSYERVWLPKPQREKQHQTLIIFDWDDTLLPSTYLAGLGRFPDASVQQELKACERASARLLKLAISLGPTIIITNALDGWVENSAKRWAPSLCPLLKKVKVFSARSKYESVYPGQPMKWKTAMFLNVRWQLNPEALTNLVAIGDSEYEMEAAQVMAKELQHVIVKLIKFTDKPCAGELQKQSEAALDGLKRIVGKAHNVRVKLRQSNAPRSDTLVEKRSWSDILELRSRSK